MRDWNGGVNEMALERIRRGAAGRPGRRAALRSAAGGMAGLVLAACGGSSPKTPARTATPRSGDTTPALPAAGRGETAGKAGGVLSVAASSNPATYDLVTQNSAAISAFISLACNGLMSFRNGSAAYPDPADTTVVPDLAAAAPEQPDATTYIFRLRPGVRWQQAPPMNGRLLTAGDVKWHFDRALHDEHSTLKAAFSSIDRVDAPDDSTVSFSLKAAYAPFLPLVIAGTERFILPREVGEAGKLKSVLIGTGPFALQLHGQNVRAVFKRNPTYFKQGSAGTRLPYTDQIDYLILPDRATALQSLQSRQTAISALLQPDELDKLRASNANDFSFMDVRGVSNYMYMRLDQPPFNDQRVRQAISLAIDRPAMLQALGKGRGVADLPIPVFLGTQSLPFSKLGAAARFYTRDVQAARQLISAAGYAGGIQTTFSYSAIYGAAFVQAAQLLQSYLKEIGIEASAKQLEYAPYLATVFKGDFDGLAYGPRSIEPDADAYLSAFYLPGAIEYQDHSDDRQLQGLITRQQQTLDAGARIALLNELQAYLSEQQYRVYDVAIGRGIAWQKAVQNYRGTDWIPLSNLETTWLMI